MSYKISEYGNFTVIFLSPEQKKKAVLTHVRIKFTHSQLSYALEPYLINLSC